MPLVDTGLATAIKDAVEGPMGITDTAKLDDFADNIATAIIDYFVANTLVTVTVAGGSSSGVHTGTIS